MATQATILLIAAKRGDRISRNLARHDYETNLEAEQIVENDAGAHARSTLAPCALRHRHQRADRPGERQLRSTGALVLVSAPR
jgi:uncharacterized membrane protein